jgi:histidinol-phosphatase (PHP family)
VDSPYKLSEWKNRDVMEVWSSYFERLTMAATSGLFEIIGHADLPKKFGHRPTADCTPLYETFLNAAKKHEEIYPSRQFLALAFQKGVPITFGSDAHAPEEVGMNFKEAIQLARSVGYRECLSFNRRKSRTIPI